MATVGEIPGSLRSKTANQETRRITPYVIITCVMAGSGGLMYGYNLVIAGNSIVFVGDCTAKHKGRAEPALCGIRRSRDTLREHCELHGSQDTSMGVETIARGSRGSVDVEREFGEHLYAARQASQEHSLFNPYTELFCVRRNRAQLVLACAFPFFQQMAGNDAVLFYGPFLFEVAGFADEKSLSSTVIIGATGLLFVCIAAFLVDKLGRRSLLLIGSIFMAAPLVVIGIIFGIKIRGNVKNLPISEGITEVAMVCLFEAAFSLSLGPLAWLIPSEIFSQEVRSVGQSVTVFVNMLFKFVIAQTLLSMMCAFKFGIFLFFAMWVMVMGIFTLLFVPETKHVSLQDMTHIWQTHWFWHHIVLPSSFSNSLPHTFPL